MVKYTYDYVRDANGWFSIREYRENEHGTTMRLLYEILTETQAHLIVKYLESIAEYRAK